MTSTIAHVENPSDRIRVQQVPQSSPGQCGICGKGQEPNGFVDPQLDFEYYGALIFCRDCTLQMAAIFGLITPEDYEEIVAEASLLRLNLAKATEQIFKLEEIVDGLTNYWRDTRPSVVSSGVFPDDESASNSEGQDSKSEFGTVPSDNPFIKPTNEKQRTAPELSSGRKLSDI